MNIMIELSELKPGGQPGRSGSEMAKEIAAIMEKHQEFWRQEANRYRISSSEQDRMENAFSAIDY